MPELKHIPVLLEKCIEELKVKPGGTYFDGTLGGGGHSYEILKHSSPSGRLFATDLDDYAIGRANERLKSFEGRYTLIKDNFKNFNKIKENQQIEGFDGILLDLGVSSFQLDDKARGFSYMAENEILDMRMNRENPLTAEKVINEYSEKQLIKILLEYGEERFASKIVKAIAERRKIKRIKTVGELNEIIIGAIPKKFQTNGHPSKKTYQAIRIEVNGELTGLYQTVIDMVHGLKSKGRIAIITFHSLEDRIVKNAFRELETDCICDKSLPVCVCGKKKEIEIITKHPIIADEQELEINPRAKSAKLRVAEKI